MTIPFLKQITLQNFLSFGPVGVAVDLAPLNVIIGPNGSGKSNLIEALSVLRAVPKDLPLPIRLGGGVRDWLHRGATAADRAELTCIFGEGHVASRPSNPPAVRYHLAFGAEGGQFVVLDERVENELGDPKPYFYFGYEQGRPMLNVDEGKRQLRMENIDRTQSVLSQRRDPEHYPELTRLGEQLGRVAIYRDWTFGTASPARLSSSAGARADTLAESLDNLPTRLAVLKRDTAVKRALLEHLTDIAAGFHDIEVVPEGGQLQLYLTEGQQNFPAQRLSDGTLRYLALLCILLDPTPPPLILIEEPELGLHFDLIHKLAPLLVEASERTQLIVTTHSDVLVDALQDDPTRIVVCEKEAGGTVLRRLDGEALKGWLDKYSLGTLWTRGDIGGTRW